MTRASVAVLAVTAVLAGCGGGEGDSAAPPANTTAGRQTTTEKVQAPTPGCDVLVVCVPEVAHEMLARCPAKRLNADGRHARKRLERVLAQIEEVDLHNKQAYEAESAAQQAFTQLEKACNA